MLSFEENANHFAVARAGTVFAFPSANPDGPVPDWLGDCPTFSDETEMPRNANTAMAQVALTIATTLVATWTFTIANASLHTQGVGNRSSWTATSADIDSTWRHTKHGWQDSATWHAADSYVPVKTIEQLHPFVWAGTVLIAVIAVMIWASSEWEIARLFENHEEPSASSVGSTAIVALPSDLDQKSGANKNL